MAIDYAKIRELCPLKLSPELIEWPVSNEVTLLVCSERRACIVCVRGEYADVALIAAPEYERASTYYASEGEGGAALAVDRSVTRAWLKLRRGNRSDIIVEATRLLGELELALLKIGMPQIRRSQLVVAALESGQRLLLAGELGPVDANSQDFFDMARCLAVARDMDSMGAGCERRFAAAADSTGADCE